MDDTVFQNGNSSKGLIVVDNFYNNPNKVRKFALEHTFVEDNTYYKGVRTKERYAPDIIKQEFERLIGSTICKNSWKSHQFNGCFQATSAENSQVYHCDQNSWAAVIYLSPNAPVESGTRILKSKCTGMVDSALESKETLEMTFQSGYYDSTSFEVLDNIGNVFNRLVLFKSTQIHAAGPYFGTNLLNGRLIHLFFFNTETF